MLKTLRVLGFMGMMAATLSCSEKEGSLEFAAKPGEIGGQERAVSDKPDAQRPAGLSSHEENTLLVADLAEDLSANLDKTIRVRGLVSHVCKHSGKKLFLVGVEKGQNLKVVAAGSLSGFDVALEGTEVVVAGRLVKTAVGRQGHEGDDDNCAMKQISGYALEAFELTGSY
jgi:hypothetical protein